MTIESIVIYLLIGAISALSAGIFGIGGGIIMVPALKWAFSRIGMPEEYVMHAAIGSSLASMVFTAFFSAYAHYRKNGIEWQTFRYLISGLLIGAIVGIFIAKELSSYILSIIFGSFALLVSVSMFFERSGRKNKLYKPSVFSLNIIGLIIGFLSTLLGIGGGTISVPVLSWKGLNIRQSIATSAACTLPISIVGFIGYFLTGLSFPHPRDSLGFIYLPATICIIITSTIFPFLGAKLTYSLPISALKKAFAVVIAVIGIGMIIT